MIDRNGYVRQAETWSPKFVEDAVNAKLRQMLRDKLQEVAKEVVDQVVLELQQNLKTDVAMYVNAPNYRNVIDVRISDKRVDK